MLLAALTVGWAFDWPMIRIALAEIPVWTFRGLCAGAGALGTLMLPVVGFLSSMLVLGERPSWQQYGALLVMGGIATVVIPRPVQGPANAKPRYTARLPSRVRHSPCVGPA